MIGCQQGCLHVFYCSNKCEQQHWDKFHQYECPFLDKIFALQDFGFNDEVINYARLVMRMLTHRLQEVLGMPYDVSMEDIWIGRSHFDKFAMEKKNEFETVAKILTEYILTRLIPHSIKDNHEFIDFVQSFLPDSIDVEKIEINDSDLWLTEMTHLCLPLDDAAMMEVTKCLLIKVYILICIEEINALFHITFALEGYSQPPQTYAMGMYPSAAFVNHSCSPNLARFPVQEDTDNFRVGDVVFFATRFLKKGEEVCYSYLEREYELYTKEQVDADEIVKSQAKRKQRLKDEFFFDCDCARCFKESRGDLDTSYMALVKELKCTKSECKGWFIPSFEKHMRCEACRMSL
ncbi:unnamed protein product [Didymodactylos carnosus]|uniref:SET domain-containing protein n=1 Tax=Didymodactylos carnosus TaxID=1234261 RepID=A0A8S2HXG0_9BILA|nr:unnamed protein product [Didymodactylos carnosus]CAF3696628.1 unnamed protein product [Didymodactylos carnosus]